MKSKMKLLTGLATFALAAPIITTAASCSKKNYSSLAETISNDAISEFTNNICPIYRSSFHTRQICDYLKKRATEYGLGDSIKEDEHKEETKTTDSSGNLTFEMPATSGLEELPKIIIQAHMDMVCKANEGYDWTQGVKPVREGDRLHSVNYQSTLGADDGIGLAMILSLIKHRNEYNHGPIQFLITTDEEESPVGASWISPDWLKAPYLVNIDGEDETKLFVSCAGCQESVFEHSFNKSTNEIVEWSDLKTAEPDIKQYKVVINGLKGGHSALEIGKNKANAILLMADFLEYVMHAPAGQPVYLSSAMAPGSYTTIPDSITFTFATTIPKETLTETDVPNFEAYSQFCHPIEDTLSVTCTQIEDTEGDPYLLTESSSNKVLEYITLLPFGPISYVSETGNIETAGNFGGIAGACSTLESESCFCIETRNPDSDLETNIHIQFAIQGRSSNTWHLGPDPGQGILIPEYGYYFYIVNATNHVFNQDGSRPVTDFIKPLGWLPPWPYKHNKIWDVLTEAAIENKSPLTEQMVFAWAENGYFAYYNNDLQQACIGSKIVDAHKQTETLYLSSVKKMAFNLIYMFDNTPKTAGGN